MYCDIPDFGRCCFCMPLRRGVLIFAYLNVIFSTFMLFVYSYYCHAAEGRDGILLYKGVTTHSMTPAFCIAIYCFDFIFNCLLVYGAHVKSIMYLKVFYFFTLMSMLTGLILQVVDMTNTRYQVEMLILAFAGMFIQLYLLLLVRSLLRKLQNGTDHFIENQLHAIVLGEPTVDNRVYNNTTAPTAPIVDDF